MSTFIEKLGNTDRRVIFVLMALAVILPLALRMNLPIPIDEGPSKNMYDAIDALPEGSRVLLSFDYDPSAIPGVAVPAGASSSSALTIVS